jgi:hypothetical protein
MSGIQVFDGDGEQHKPPPKSTITMDGFTVHAGGVRSDPVEPAEQKSVWLTGLSEAEYQALQTFQQQLPMRYKKFKVVAGRGETRAITFEHVYIGDIMFGRDGGAIQACIEMQAIENAPILEKVGAW